MHIFGHSKGEGGLKFTRRSFSEGGHTFIRRSFSEGGPPTSRSKIKKGMTEKPYTSDIVQKSVPIFDLTVNFVNAISLA